MFSVALVYAFESMRLTLLMSMRGLFETRTKGMVGGGASAIGPSDTSNSSFIISFASFQMGFGTSGSGFLAMDAS
jgi:hypothetical protein